MPNQFAIKPRPVLPSRMQAHSGDMVSNIWRFYVDANHKWKWQQLSVHGQVLSESTKCYQDYETCLGNARDNGHEFQPSQTKINRGTPHDVGQTIRAE